MEDLAIKVENVCKDFKLPHEKKSSIKSIFVNLFRSKAGYERQEALKNINFEIKKGEFFGIIGRNGSGKSTLLKLLAGIYTPTTGQVHVRGSLTPFIELGVGFNPELTGRENVFLNGSLLGFSRKEMYRMYKEIVDFAELERFMDQKLKNYSSGMQVRLAFSIAVRAESDILLIDEVLAVGDSNFQRKCLEVFERLKREGRTIVFVSHDMSYIKDFCDRCVVINDGNLVFEGSPIKAVDRYNKLNLDKEVSKLEKYDNKQTIRLGNGGARINKYGLYDSDGHKTMSIKTGEKFSVKAQVDYKISVNNPVFGVIFKRNPNENLYGINNYYEKVSFGNKQAGDSSKIIYSDIMPLNPGQYYISLSVVDAESSTRYEELDALEDAMKISVSSDKQEWGIVKNSAIIIEE
jgi:ABC-2 type transport system ATP-binding protein